MADSPLWHYTGESMFKRWRLKRIHSRYLESCRNLQESRDYWQRDRNLLLNFLEALSPVPLLGLHEDGGRLLSDLMFLEASCRQHPLQVDTLRKFHTTLYPKETPGAGEYRKGQAVVLESRFARPPFQKVPALMMQLEGTLVVRQGSLDRQSSSPLDPVLDFALDVHHRIAFIHPFQDGNGRIARLAMSYILRRYGHGYVILPPISESPEHFAALEEAHAGNPDRFRRLAKEFIHTP